MAWFSFTFLSRQSWKRWVRDRESTSETYCRLWHILLIDTEAALKHWFAVDMTIHRSSSGLILFWNKCKWHRKTSRDSKLESYLLIWALKWKARGPTMHLPCKKTSSNKIVSVKFSFTDRKHCYAERLLDYIKSDLIFVSTAFWWLYINTWKLVQDNLHVCVQAA